MRMRCLTNTNSCTALVDKLIDGGLLKAGEQGSLIIEREEEPAVPEPQRHAPEAQRQARGQSGAAS